MGFLAGSNQKKVLKIAGGMALFAGIAIAAYMLTNKPSGTVTNPIVSTAEKSAISTPSIVGVNEKKTIRVSEKSTETSAEKTLQPTKEKSVKKAIEKPILIAGRYIKLDSNGKPLKNQHVSYQEQTWQCVKDVKTNLIWEVKTLKGLHATKEDYNWKDSFTFKDKVNQQGWCGATDWRVPKIEELRSLVYCSNGILQKEAWDKTCKGKDGKNTYQSPTIEQQVFPNTQSSWYWSSSPYADDASVAWYVVFDDGYDHALYKFNYGHVRLVRSGQ